MDRGQPTRTAQSRDRPRRLRSFTTAPASGTSPAARADNLSGPSAVRLEEAWIQVNLFSSRVSVLGGRYDLNTEFYRLQSAGLFVNSSLGVGPECSQSGQAGPSIFPSTSIGVRFAYKPVGAWYYTATFPDVSETTRSGAPVAHSGSGGLYAIADTVVVRSRREDKRQLTAFAEVGLGDQRVNRFGTYVGTGLVATGPFASRPGDELGVAVALARNGSHFLAQQGQMGLRADRAECAIELTYLAQIAARFALQPDFQHIVHPNTTPSVKNANVLQLRFELRF